MIQKIIGRCNPKIDFTLTIHNMPVHQLCRITNFIVSTRCPDIYTLCTKYQISYLHIYAVAEYMRVALSVHTTRGIACSQYSQ